MSIHGREGKLYYAPGRIHTHKASVWFEELSHVFSESYVESAQRS